MTKSSTRCQKLYDQEYKAAKLLSLAGRDKLLKSKIELKERLYNAVVYKLEELSLARREIGNSVSAD